MKHTSRWVWGAWGVFLAVACGTATSKNKAASTAGSGPHPHGTHTSAPHSSHGAAAHGTRAHGASDPLAADPRATAGTSHHFEPRPLVDHGAPAYRITRAAWRLPAFVDGSAQCFRNYPEPPYSLNRYQGGGGIGYGAGSVSSSAQSAPSGSKAKPSFKSAAAPKSRSAPPPSSASSRADARSGRAEVESFAMAERKGASPRNKAEHHPAASASAPPAEAADTFAASRDREYEDSSYPVSTADGYGAAIYLSNDDTMSLSSAQRLIYAIERFAPLPPEHVRPHELLNYFSFQTEAVPSNRDFSVAPSIAPHPDKPGVFTLAMAVQGRPVSTATRRNANLSFVLDRSGSMSAEGRMEYVKRGMLQSLSQLKQGDIVGITLFDSSVCQLAQNFVVGRDDVGRLRSLIERIQPTGSTNLHDGLQQGYQIANAAYQDDYTNRVVMITDALTNTGVTDASLISMVGKHYDDRKIRLSGVGVGRDFNDDLLDQLTERGKGAYVFLGSDAEVDAVFGSRFVSLIETVANDVHFRLHLPPSLAMDVFYGEEASVEKERVQAIHYFAGTSQMFLSDLKTRFAGFPGSDDIMVTIEYQDPETGTDRVEEYAWNLGQIYAETSNIKKARLVDHFARSLGEMASRGLPQDYGYRAHSWDDPAGYQECLRKGDELSALSQGLGHDPEVSKVQRLWTTVCDRYVVAPMPPRPRHHPTPGPLPHPTPPYNPGPPERNNDFAPPDQWPSAQR